MLPLDVGAQNPKMSPGEAIQTHSVQNVYIGTYLSWLR